MLVKPGPRNAPFPMLVTESGMATSTSERQLKNTPSPMTKVTVLRCVADEVLCERAGIVERQRLETFLGADAQVVDFSETDVESWSLSLSDQCSLTYCMRNRADWLVADERLLRRVARAKGISVVGALGILLQAVRAGNLSRSDARQDVEAAIAEHGLRISVALYQRVLQELG